MFFIAFPNYVSGERLQRSSDFYR